LKSREKELRKKHEEVKKKKAAKSKKPLKSMVQSSFYDDNYYSRNPADETDLFDVEFGDIDIRDENEPQTDKFALELSETT